jgi:hypothetical protein
MHYFVFNKKNIYIKKDKELKRIKKKLKKKLYRF